MALYVVQALDIGKCMVGWAHLSKSPVIWLGKLSPGENKQSTGPNRHSIGDDTSSW